MEKKTFSFEGCVIQNVSILTCYNFKESHNSLCDLSIMMYTNNFHPLVVKFCEEK